MNNEQQSYKEDRSLLEVREWKEACRQQTEQLTPQEYLLWIRRITDELLKKYQLTLQVVHR